MTLRRSALWLAWGFCAACASAPAPSQERIDAAFRAIQRGEARIDGAARDHERVAASIAPDSGACGERCEPLDSAGQEGREGVADVCNAAQTIEGDDDARLRCERARQRGEAIDQGVQALKQRCGCGEGGAP